MKSNKFLFCIFATVACLHFSFFVSYALQAGKPYSKTWKFSSSKMTDAAVPLVICTWSFTEATQAAWDKLKEGSSVLDAVEVGCTRCEELQCDNTVGFGGSPDENGETTLDALIMNGETHSSGAVACLRRIKPAISVARMVMEHTKHSLLAGDLATEFAIKMGFKEENLTSEDSAAMHGAWKNNSCQPNFWKNVFPDPTKYCGPYFPRPRDVEKGGETEHSRRLIDRYNHDTVSMVVISADRKLASGTSSNGARNKIPGRVGDAPIVGAGSYVDKDVGGAASTGDGDIMMRFLPSLVAVEKMRDGFTPREAAQFAIARIAKMYPNFSGALVAANLAGEYGAACHNIENGFPYSVINEQFGTVRVETANCTMSADITQKD